ncbi:MAG TPA: CaiB/BaiF CoA-transferase family protein [Candidatus Acidoferrum sp.]|nr:CaiB/BaiF CoA-transferase family protein [Candidatus Acidoferrum sp.]
MVGPLHGIRVLDASRILTGPFCSMILGDLGAEIIKIERPVSGDDTRQWGPPFIANESAYFLSVNRNKKSVTLNLETQKGKEIFYALAEKSDVLLENFRPGVAERLGIDYSTIAMKNARLIYCSITGFGQTGRYRERAGYDIVSQGMGGLMGVTGESDRPPVRVGVAMSDIGAGMYAATAILSALLVRERSGRGQSIDVALFDSTVSWMTYMAGYYFATGKDPSRSGSAHPTIVPYQCFRTLDENYVTIAAGNDKLFRNLCRALGRKELAADPRFTNNSQRIIHRQELISIIEEIFLTKTRDDWIRILIETDVPTGPVYSMSELFNDPQVKDREMLVEVDHARLGKLKQIGIPMKFSETEPEIKSSPPVLGEHTAEVLGALLGYDDARLRELKEKGVI